MADPPRRVWRDWALAAALVALAIVEVILRPELTYRWLSFVVALAGIPLLLVRRTHPLPAVLAVFGATGLVLDIPWVIGGAEGQAPGLYTMGYVMVLAYALFRWGSGRHALIGVAVMLTVATLNAIADYTGLSEAIGGFALFFLIIAAGVAMRYRARAKSKERDELRARERVDLARDLHDTVAHHVSAIAIRAQAGVAVAQSDPAAAVEALRVIDAEASRTLAEMRTIVRDLRRDEAPELSPLPGLDAVRALAAATPGSGPVVHVAIDGDASRVPASVAAAAYRLAQESVTNARRHARHPSRIDVVLRAGDDALTVEVTDDGDDASGRPGEGYGIVGMTERAEGLGGSLTAGPRAGRGWTVTAVLPLRGASA